MTRAPAGVACSTHGVQVPLHSVSPLFSGIFFALFFAAPGQVEMVETRTTVVLSESRGTGRVLCIVRMLIHDEVLLNTLLM